MDECYGKNYILNREFKPSAAFNNSLVYDGDSIYEVIRTVKGTPLFFYDHVERLENSVRNQQKQMLAGIEELRQDIIRISGPQGNNEANLKIVFNYNNDRSNYLLYFIRPIYPTQDQYDSGVKGILYPAERKDPSSKVINHRLRSEIFHKLILERAYEAILVDHSSCITEGSRSNIFFIRDGILYTAPENKILSGITRKYIIEICTERNIKVVMECVKADAICLYDSAFMSGTSPMVLPFSCIDDRSFDVKDPLLKELRTLYIEKAEESIVRFRSE